MSRLITVRDDYERFKRSIELLVATKCINSMSTAEQKYLIDEILEYVTIVEEYTATRRSDDTQPSKF